MKTTKLALCGLLALGLNSAAFAATAQLATAGLTALEESQSPVARQFARQLEESLGVKMSAPVADVQAALSKLSPSQRASVVSAINAYAKKAVSGNSIDARNRDDDAARSALMTNGAVLKVAAVTKDSTSRSAIKNVNNSLSCSTALPQILAQKSGFSEARVSELLSKGVLVAAGDCGKEITDMSAEADRHLVAMADCAENSGITSAAEDQKDGIYGNCLVKSFANDNVKLAAEDGIRRAAGVRNDCGFVR